jgi:hypothetical protein
MPDIEASFEKGHTSAAEIVATRDVRTIGPAASGRMSVLDVEIPGPCARASNINFLGETVGVSIDIQICTPNREPRSEPIT